MDEVFQNLRRYARGHNQRLNDVARHIVHGDLRIEAVLASVRHPQAAAASTQH